MLLYGGREGSPASACRPAMPPHFAACKHRRRQRSPPYFAACNTASGKGILPPVNENHKRSLFLKAHLSFCLKEQTSWHQSVVDLLYTASYRFLQTQALERVYNETLNPRTVMKGPRRYKNSDALLLETLTFCDSHLQAVK